MFSTQYPVFWQKKVISQMISVGCDLTLGNSNTVQLSGMLTSNILRNKDYCAKHLCFKNTSSILSHCVHNKNTQIYLNMQQ